MLNVNRLGDDGTEAARTAEAGKRNNDMDEKDDEITHLGIVAGRRKAGDYGINRHKLAIRYRQGCRQAMC